MGGKSSNVSFEVATLISRPLESTSLHLAGTMSAMAPKPRRMEHHKVRL